jgi:hypothetical protein
MSEQQQRLPPLGPETDLKAERVAEKLAMPVFDAPGNHQEAPPEGADTDLLPEEIAARVSGDKVQERLQRMLGWSLAQGGHAIDRVRELASPMTAADYGGLVLREAARTKQKVRVGLVGSRVVITVMAASQGAARGFIGHKQLDFAAGLG